MIMNTGANSRDEVAGSWVQPCFGCGKAHCKTHSTAEVFVVAPALPADILNQKPLRDLFEARAELYPGRISIPGSVTIPPPPSSAPGGLSSLPLVTSAPSRLADFLPPTSSVFSLSPSPPPQAAPSVSSGPEERSQSPVTPPQRNLNFYFGGYGGVHYSPDGHFVVPPPVVDVSDADSTIIVHDSDSDVTVHDSKSDMGTIIVSDSEDGDLLDLQYTPLSPLVMPPITLDLCVDVTLGPRPFLTKVWFRPAPTEPHSIRLGDVVMADFKAYLESKGLPAGAQIEQFLDLNSTFLDITHCWVPCTWSEKIAIFGRDKILYFRTCGTNVTLPAHFVDLL
ncbi:hypothetical protein C8J57DRAFT_1262467 [Mycena rebaudengoi]|nr:hypothetical protein C8J57DRAFT_1262467 [Mycena rebaudengoi]